jgi:murein DD-endopeptidase MepM/ murein hydrolase activator NlpD
MKEKTHNASHLLALALICGLAWQNSSLSLREHTLLAENKSLRTESTTAVNKVAELEQVAAHIENLSKKIDNQDFTSSQYIMAYSNIQAKAPLMQEGLDKKDDDDHACVTEPWFADGRGSYVAKRLAKLEGRLRELTTTLAQVNTNMQNRKAALDSVPTILPVGGEVTSPFGVRRDPVHGNKLKQHTGIDIKAPYGTDVIATAYGVVESAAYNRGYGLVVTISHGNGIHTKYAHNSKALVKRGDVVAKGQKIAKSGSSGHATGAHCHYEVLLDRTPVNPELFVIDKSKVPDRSNGAKPVYVEGVDVFGLGKGKKLNRSL